MIQEGKLQWKLLQKQNLEYISSAGLRQVIVAYKKMAQKDGFKIINVSDEVYDVFSLTGFDSKIDIQKK